MRQIIIIIVTLIAIISVSHLKIQGEDMNNENIYGFEAVNIDGRNVSLSEYKGKVILIVNVASKCGFTKQYAGLEELYNKYKDKGFTVLGFPCNQFKNQEPGTNAEIKEFCSLNFGVTFDLFEKIDVNGANAHPLYKFLTKKVTGTFGDSIKWNFTKFLIDKEGKPVKRFAPQTEPKSFEKDIEALLNG